MADVHAVAPPSTKPAFRGDVEGLRGVAILLVLLFNGGVPIVGGGGFIGVDVFFVISGFVITGLLVKEVDRTSWIALADFYARRARRILPSAAFVTVIVLGVAAAAGSADDRHEAGVDGLAATLQFANWHFLGYSADTLNERIHGSPLHHYWSLAVEEQFYLVWPLVMIAVLWVARRRGMPWKKALVVGSVVLSVASLAASVVLTYQHQLLGYFASPARFFEFGSGAVLAIGASRVRRWSASDRGSTAGLLFGWAGLLVLAASVLIVTRFPFPGFIAVLPAAGTAAVILAGGLTARRWSVPWALNWRPLRFVGRISYVWYLWHVPATTWAVLVAGRTEWWFLLSIELAAIVPAYLTSILVERPFRYARVFSGSPLRGLALGGALTAVTAATAGLLVL